MLQQLAIASIAKSCRSLVLHLQKSVAKTSYCKLAKSVVQKCSATPSCCNLQKSVAEKLLLRSKGESTRFALPPLPVVVFKLAQGGGK